jgi:hypothetical protein
MSVLANLDGHDGSDLAIRYGSGKWSGLKAALPATAHDGR